jgi:hypothetical protein
LRLLADDEPVRPGLLAAARPDLVAHLAVREAERVGEFVPRDRGDAPAVRGPAKWRLLAEDEASPPALDVRVAEAPARAAEATLYHELDALRGEGLTVTLHGIV